MNESELITIPFTTEDGDTVEMYVLEETTLQNVHYLLVSDEVAEDAEAYILKEDGQETDEEYSVYVPVEDETELEAVAKVFEELMGDIDFEVQD